MTRGLGLVPDLHLYSLPILRSLLFLFHSNYAPEITCSPPGGSVPSEPQRLRWLCNCGTLGGEKRLSAILLKDEGKRGAVTQMTQGRLLHTVPGAQRSLTTERTCGRTRQGAKARERKLLNFVLVAIPCALQSIIFHDRPVELRRPRTAQPLGTPMLIYLTCSLLQRHLRVF